MTRYSEIQKLGIDYQSRRFGSLIIDLKMNSIVLDDKVDHAAGINELILIRFTHRQNTHATQGPQNFAVSFFFDAPMNRTWQFVTSVTE